MKPQEEFHNGGDHEAGSDSSEEEEGCELAVEGEEALRLLGAALGALNALRVARLHCDVTLAAAGAELPAHAALVVAHAPALLAALPPSAASPAVLRAPDVSAPLARRLLDYMYSGRLCARDAADGRALALAAWRLHMDQAQAAMTRLLAQRALHNTPDPNQVLLLRALPDLPEDVTIKLDAYIRQNFEEVWLCEAMSSLPLVEISMVRVTSSPPVRESAAAVAEAALHWLRQHRGEAPTSQLSGTHHQAYVDDAGAVRWCGDLPEPEAATDELGRWRSEALAGGGGGGEAGAARGGPGRQPVAQWGVVAARGQRGLAWALALAGGALVRARVAGRALAAGAGAGLGAALAGRGAAWAGRCALGAGAVRGALLAAGGYTRGEVLAAAARLEVAPEAPHPPRALWRPAPPLPAPRARAAAASLHDCLYIVGGSDGHKELDTVDVYEENSLGEGRWRSAPRCPIARSHAGAAAVSLGSGGALYVVGGTADGRTLRAVHRYCPVTSQWSTAPALTAGRSSAAAVHWGGALWALGGCDEWRCVASTESLPVTVTGAGITEGEWRPGPPLGAARRSAGAAQWRGRLVLAGGSLGAASTTKVEWLTQEDPLTWRAGPSLRRARASLALVSLGGPAGDLAGSAGSSSEVLVAVAGFDGKEFLSCVEVLYEADGQWTLLTSDVDGPDHHISDELHVLSLNGEHSEEDTEQKKQIKEEKQIAREEVIENQRENEA